MTPIDGTATVETVTAPGNTTYRRIMGCFRCDNCSTLSIALGNAYTTKINSGAAMDWLLSQQEGRLTWMPRRLRKAFPDVPQEIAEAASEAYSCLGIDAWRAAVLLARSVIEATAKQKGITKGRLIEKIDEMYDQRLIREHIRDGAHEVRHLGNDTAHGDFAEPVTREEADLVLTLMSEVLVEVYQSPARVARAKAAREARKDQPITPQNSPRFPAAISGSWARTTRQEASTTRQDS